MIFSVSFSKPSGNAKNLFEREYKKIKARLITSSSSEKQNTELNSKDHLYFVELFTETQVFHKKFTETELISFIEEHAGNSFKNCIIRTESEEITILSNKKGKKTELRKPLTKEKMPEQSRLSAQGEVLPSECVKDSSINSNSFTFNRQKNYLLPENIPVPFLVRLGIMTSSGKVISSKFDKFRQINRFLEFIDDILPSIKTPGETNRPLRIIDFGSGKSYLTFAVHYFLTEVKKIPAEITGLDLKKDVIEYCKNLASELHLKNLNFETGDISTYGKNENPDLVITLHACDTATDYALKYAIEKNVKAILSVPCCQHEINLQLENTKKTLPEESPFTPILKHGILRERFAALVTDALRAEYLESKGYKVQLLEFIDMSHTPKKHTDSRRAEKRSHRRLSRRWKTFRRIERKADVICAVELSLLETEKYNRNIMNLFIISLKC